MNAQTMIDPKELTPAQRRVMAALGYYAHCHRHAGGWACGTNAISFGLAQALIAKGLIRQQIISGKSTLILTGEGRNTLNVWQFRRAQKEGRKSA